MAATRKKAPAIADEALDRFDFQRDALGYALRRAQMRTYDLFFEMLGKLELTPARLTALSLIATEPGLTQAALAKRLDIAGPSVLKLVDALQQAGFIARADVADDRRRYALEITPAGREKLETVRDELAAYEERLARRLSKAERAQLMDLLSRVAS